MLFSWPVAWLLRQVAGRSFPLSFALTNSYLRPPVLSFSLFWIHARLHRQASARVLCCGLFESGRTQQRSRVASACILCRGPFKPAMIRTRGIKNLPRLPLTMAHASKKPLSGKYTDVSILFLAPDEDAISAHAQVIERENEMVISIMDQDSSGPYLVVGKKVGHFFAGVDSLKHEERVNVVARWASLGDAYVGIWIEEGIEYLFSFRVHRSSG